MAQGLDSTEASATALWGKQRSGARVGLITKAALDYLRLGWSVIPVEPRGKRPLIDWHAYQYRRAEPPEVGDWLRRWPEANLAVVTGLVSGLVVLDLDPVAGGDVWLKARAEGARVETAEVRSGRGSRHIYFAHPGVVVPSRLAIAEGVALLGDAGCVVVPPSLHACGEAYRWVRSPEVVPLSRVPAWLANLVSRGPHDPGGRITQWQRFVSDGAADLDPRRDLAALARYLGGRGVEPVLAMELIQCWHAAHCDPSLDPAEVRDLIEPILQRPQDGGQAEG